MTQRHMTELVDGSRNFDLEMQRMEDARRLGERTFRLWVVAIVSAAITILGVSGVRSYFLLEEQQRHYIHAESTAISDLEYYRVRHRQLVEERDQLRDLLKGRSDAQTQYSAAPAAAAEGVEISLEDFGDTPP